MGIPVKSLKIVIFAFNLILVILGCALLIFGVDGMHLLGENSSLYDFTSNNLYFIVFGAAAVILGLLAFCATVTESPCCLLTYGIMLLLLFGVEFVIGTIVLSHLNEVILHMQTKLEEKFLLYYRDEEIRNYLDRIQTHFECCGFRGPHSLTAIDFVPSCCANGVTCSMTSPDLYMNACGDNLYYIFGYNALIIAFILIFIGTYQAILGSLAFYLRRLILQNHSRY